MRRQRAIRALFPLAAAVLSTAAVLAAPEEPSAPRFGVELNVTLRTARVLVQAPEGRSSSGLTAADFRVIEGDQPMEIVSADEVRVPRRGGSLGAEALRELPPLSRADASRIGARRWIVLFDSINPGPVQNVSRLKKDLKRFAREKLGPHDDMAVVFAGTMGLDASPFHDDPAEIAAAIDGARLKPQDLPRARHVPEQPRAFDENQAASRRGVIDPGASHAGPTPPPFERNLIPVGSRRFFGTDDLERRTFTSRYLRIVEDLSKALRVVPGRKVLILLSAGFRGTDLLNDQVVAKRFHQAVRTLMDSGTTVYSIDTTGLNSPIQDEIFSAGIGYLQYSNPVAAEAGLGAERLRSVSVDFFDRQGGSYLLAEQTGGEFLHGMNRFDRHLDRIESLEAGYYVVSWYSSLPRDAEFRSFRIEVARPGFRVAGPKGYFAEKPFSRMDAVDREAQLLELAEWGTERLDLPAEARADLFPDGLGGRVAVVSAVLRSAEVQTRSHPRGEDPVDVVVAARDPAGGFARWERSSLAETSLAVLPADGWWHYQHSFPVAGPAGRISLVLRENERGRVLSRSFDLPELPERGLTPPVRIQALKPLTRSRGGKTPRDPFDFGGIHLAPAETSRLAASTRLYLLFEAYSLGRGEDLAFEYRLDGRRLIPGPAPEQVHERRVVHPGKDLISVLSLMPTADLRPGLHLVEIDSAGGSTTRYPFEILSGR